MEQSESDQPDRVIAVTYVRCTPCRFLGQVITVEEDLNSVFSQARAHALTAHAGESMTGIEIVWDVIPAC
ncbi:hypothetical protein ACWC3X_43890 [Streptomyces populi]